MPRVVQYVVVVVLNFVSILKKWRGDARRQWLVFPDAPMPMARLFGLADVRKRCLAIDRMFNFDRSLSQNGGF